MRDSTTVTETWVAKADLYVARLRDDAGGGSKTLSAIFQRFDSVFSKPMAPQCSRRPAPGPAPRAAPALAPNCCNFNLPIRHRTTAHRGAARLYISINSAIHSRLETSYRLAHNPRVDASPPPRRYVSSECLLDVTLFRTATCLQLILLAPHFWCWTSPYLFTLLILVRRKFLYPYWWFYL